MSQQDTSEDLEKLPFLPKEDAIVNVAGLKTPCYCHTSRRRICNMILPQLVLIVLYTAASALMIWTNKTDHAHSVNSKSLLQL